MSGVFWMLIGVMVLGAVIVIVSMNLGHLWNENVYITVLATGFILFVVGGSYGSFLGYKDELDNKNRVLAEANKKYQVDDAYILNKENLRVGEFRYEVVAGDGIYESHINGKDVRFKKIGDLD